MARSPEFTRLLTTDEEGLSPELVTLLPEPWRFRRPSAQSYDLSDPALSTAVKAALLLGQPLILAGDPGVGKTTLAAALSARLGVPLLPPAQVKSTTVGLDFFYHFDEVARFRDASSGDNMRGLRDYIRFSSLGRAILRSAGPDTPVATGSVPLAAILGGGGGHTPLTLGSLFPREFNDAEPVRCMVLLDEIDKAGRDAPNDILGEIETMAFDIRELGISVAARRTHWPIVLITSNSERSLPDAFLRRCVYHWIDFPGDDRLRNILVAHCARDWSINGKEQLVTSSIELFRALRGEVENKKPATAELISFVIALLEFGLPSNKPVDRGDARVQQLIGVLIKTRIDDEKVRAPRPGIGA